jgi:hypothetical protein
LSLPLQLRLGQHVRLLLKLTGIWLSLERSLIEVFYKLRQ